MSVYGTTTSTLGDATTTASGVVTAFGGVTKTLDTATGVATGYVLPPTSASVGAVAFNAAADALRNNSGSVPADNTAYTVGGWIRLHSTQDPSNFFVSDASGNGSCIGLNSGVLIAHNGNYSAQATIAGALTDAKWYFVAMRVNGTSITLSRGDETTGVTHNTGTCAAQGATFRIWLGGTPDAFFPTADFALWWIYDAILSDAEIEAQRTSPTLVRTSNVTADWPLDSAANKLVDRHGGAQPLVAVSSGPWSDVSDGPAFNLGSSGVAINTLADATCAASGNGGSIPVDGTVAQTLANSTSSASGYAQVTGSVAKTLGDATLVGVGELGPGPLDWSTLMPLISRPGKPYYGTGTPGQMFDGFYGYVDGTSDGAWSCTGGSWVAVQVGAGPSQVLVGISNDNATGGSYLATVIEAYRLQVSNNSTNGTDGTWTTAVTVTGNTAYAREHKFSFTGYSWVKLLVDTCSGGQLDELNVWDASNGTPDTFAFLGDSITDGALRRQFWFGGGGYLPSFQENVLANELGHYPLQLNVGVTGQGASYWATNISGALSLYPDMKYWCINIGMNDGSSMPSQLSQFRTDMTTIVNAINSAGRYPIIARTTWTGAAGYGGGDYVTSQLRYLNDNGVDYIATTLGVRKGPDLFALFYANGATYAVTTDPHPNATGYKAWTKAWADNLGVSDAIYGTVVKSLDDGTLAAAGTASGPSVSGTVAVPLADAALAGVGASGAVGSLVQTLANATLAAAGTSLVTGTLAQTLANATLVGTGTHSIAGSLVQTLANSTSVGVGASGSAGSLAQTLGNFTSTGTGASGVAGTTAQTLANSTLVAIGQFGANPSGTVAQTLANATLVGTGTVTTTLLVPFRGSTLILSSPTVQNLNTLTAPRQNSTLALFGPVVQNLNTLTAPRRNSSLSLFGPAVQTLNTLSVPFHSSTAQLLSPALTKQPYLLDVPQISATQLFSPVLIQTGPSQQFLSAPRIASVAAVYSPTALATNTLQPPRIASGANLFNHIARLNRFNEVVVEENIPLIRALELPLPATLTRILGIHQSDVIIRAAIAVGLADLRANPQLLDYVFASLPQDTLTWKEYGEKDVNEAKKWFVSTAIPVSVLPQINESKWPQITIELLDSSEVVPEATIGDINYDAEEDNDSTWPPLTPPFTPSSYKPTTGQVSLAVVPEVFVCPGMFVIDRQGSAHEILDVTDQQNFTISSGTVADLRGCVFKSHRPSWKVSAESSSFRETYRIGVHVQSETSHLTWLHSILVFSLLRYKQVLMEARGFERSTIQSSQMTRDERFEVENIFSRYITITGNVRQFWPKTIAPVIDGVKMDALRFSGQDGAGVRIADTGVDPASQLWRGNLDD